MMTAVEVISTTVPCTLSILTSWPSRQSCVDIARRHDIGDRGSRAERERETRGGKDGTEGQGEDELEHPAVETQLFECHHRCNCDDQGVGKAGQCLGLLFEPHQAGRSGNAPPRARRAAARPPTIRAAAATMLGRYAASLPEQICQDRESENLDCRHPEQGEDDPEDKRPDQPRGNRAHAAGVESTGDRLPGRQAIEHAFAERPPEKRKESLPQPSR